MKTILFFILLLFSFQSFSQTKIDDGIDIAYMNAKKGIYWSLTNIPENKTRVKHDLIDKDKLYSTVQIIKEIDGIKILSTGYCNSTEVKITIYRSFKSLKKEGYLKVKRETREDTTKQLKKKSRKKRKK